MLFLAILYLISCLGNVGNFLYPSHETRGPGSRPLNGTRIEYPADMVAQKKEGKVVLTCDVEVSGVTSHCQVIQSSGEKSFDNEALRYVERARYRPTTKNGIPVREIGHRYTITFKL